MADKPLCSALWGIVLSCLVFSAEAQVTDAPKQNDARALFDKGNALAKKGRYLDALNAFEQSHAASPNPVVLFNMGMCLKALERLLEATDVFERYLTEAGEHPTPDLREQAKNTLRGIAEEIPRLFVKGAPLNAKIQLDDKAPRALAGAEDLRANPGRHRIRISAAGYLDYETSFEAVCGGRTTIEIEMSRLSTLTVDCDDPSARITVNRKDAGGCPFQGDFAPGTLLVRATAPGKIPFEKTLTLYPGQKEQLTVRLRSASEASTHPVADAPVAPKTFSSATSQFTSRKFFSTTLRTLWFSGSAVIFFGGAAMVGVSYGLYSKAPDRLDTLTPLNTAGWAVGGLGLGSAAAFALSGLLANQQKNRTAIAINPDPHHPMLFMARRF